jgi:hypothetical protein
MTKRCMQPGCTKEGITKVEDDQWMCREHITERIHSPENMALNNAEVELEEFFEAGDLRTHLLAHLAWARQPPGDAQALAQAR